jgi:amino acid transporter, AAT family
MSRTLNRSSWWTFGVLNVVVVLAASLAGWYLLADPSTSPLDVYPLPFNAALFWALLFVVWSGFNLELVGFASLPQPVRGVAVTAAAIGFGVVMTWLLAEGLGAVNADFAGSREGGVGYFTGALFVLFGFSTYVMVVVNWDHWPWRDLGLDQPQVGWSEIAFLMLPTILLYVVLGLPTLSLAAEPGAALLSLDTLLGWYYSLIVAIVLTGSLWGNWPWRHAGSRARTAVASVVGNLVLGTALYFALLGASKTLLGADNTRLLGDVIHQFPAQLGVCWVAWMIVWSNAFGNKPTDLAEPVNLVVRGVVTFALAAATFAGYYFVVAEHLLHEPPVVGSISGNALGFMDWFALVALLYVVGFESFGLPKPADPATTAEPAAAAAAQH